MTDPDYAAFKIDDLTRRMREAKTKDCKRSWCRKLIVARYERGDFPMIADLDAATLEALVRVTMEEER